MQFAAACSSFSSFLPFSLPYATNAYIQSWPTLETYWLPQAAAWWGSLISICPLVSSSSLLLVTSGTENRGGDEKEGLWRGVVR